MSGSTLSAPADPVFAMHRGGKISVRPSVDVTDRQGLAMAYTPGVARVCTAIAEAPDLAADYTWVSNAVAVVTDGTAVLGLGDIGPAAAMPVMEGKSLLFKRFAGVDAIAALVGADAAPGYIIPGQFDERVAPAVAAVVATQARADAVSRR